MHNFVLHFWPYIWGQIFVCSELRFETTIFLLASERIKKLSKILQNEHTIWMAGVLILQSVLSLSQDVVDWSVAGTVWRTALGITSSRRKSDHVPHSHCNSRVHRGQPVHDAGQTLQTRHSWSSVHRTSCIDQERGNYIISDKQYMTQRTPH